MCMINEMDDLVWFSSVGSKFCVKPNFQISNEGNMQCKALQS
jgi:hypothetical protein